MDDVATLPGEDATLPHDESAPAAAAAELPRGAALGRYVVLGRLGAGAMGVVYAAYDPELDRKIAIKLLHRASGSAPQRLLREAQAMARLRHPNVVTVHDVGVVTGRGEAAASDGREASVFLAMELIDGTTLQQWIEEGGDRPRARVLEVLRAAGRGLAAAHRAGLVHRDFKPDNVLVGRDGTVVVTDFGLARAAGGDDDSTAVSMSGHPVLDAELTRSGSLVGTPAYMAPEQFSQSRGTPAADQFSFCVTVYQALYRERPFSGDSLAALATAVSTGKVRSAPAGSDVPAWLRRVILRGLAVDPAARWPDMDALLDALGRDPARTRRRVAAGVLGGGAALALLSQLPSATEAPTPCPAADERLVGVWDDARRDALHAALLATDAPFAANAAEGATAWLDDYRAQWLDAVHDACAATRIAGTQSEALLDRRMACLERRRTRVRAAVDRLLEADARLAGRALDILGAITPVEPCADVEHIASTDIRPEDPRLREQAAAVIERLDELDAAIVASAAAPLLGEHEALLAEAEAIGHLPLVAEAAEQLARTLLAADEPERAREAFARALRAGARSGHDVLVADVWTDLITVVGDELHDPKTAATIAEAADIAVLRTGDPPRARALYETHLGIVARTHGNFDDAVEHHRRALALRRETTAGDGPDLAATLNNLGNALATRGDLAEAIEIHTESVAMRERLYGADHPRVAESLNNLGAALNLSGKKKESLEQFQRAVEVRRRVYGSDHASVASALGNVGSTLMELGRPEEAEAVQREALAIQEEVHGPDHPHVATQLNNLANTLERLGRPDEALPLHERALEIRTAKLGEDHPVVALSLHNLGVLVDNQGRHEEARSYFLRSIAIHDARNPNDPEVMGPLMRLAQLDLEVDPERAAAGAERAVAIGARTGHDPAERGRAEFVLARAKWKLGRDRAGARALAEAAAVRLRERDVDPEVVAEIERWLQAHGGR